MNFILLKEIEFPNYIRQYLKSKNTRAKYFEKGKKKLPLVFCNKVMWKEQKVRVPDGVKYNWCSFPVVRQGAKKYIDFLVDVATGEKVTSNQQNIGKERYENINGQGILSGNIRSFEKDMMLGQIKDYFRTFLRGLSPIEYFPLVLRMEVHDVLVDQMFNNGQEWDLDNRFIPYSKALHDLLCEDITDKSGTIIQKRLIPDDNVKYITGPMQPLFVPIENPDKRKMILKIYKDNRSEIMKDLEYQFLLKEKLLYNIEKIGIL